MPRIDARTALVCGYAAAASALIGWLAVSIGETRPRDGRRTEPTGGSGGMQGSVETAVATQRTG